MTGVFDFKDADSMLEQQLERLHPLFWQAQDLATRANMLNLCQQLLDPLYHVPDGFFVRLGAGVDSPVVQTFSTMFCLLSGSHLVSRYRAAGGKVRFLRQSDFPHPLGSYEDITAEHQLLHKALQASSQCPLPGADTVAALHWLKQHQVLPTTASVDVALARRDAGRREAKVLRFR
ncbi:hypothetical protein ACTOWA_00200 [Herbaspirillum seropedicae]|uniref:hypothetical protein n=1 Tax=Herbaspirillum seropedicae TaxID=964 RepID=UPI002855FCA6|nr:hypothetical protein [Herbaspirillum seropedicae]MDR6397991.1 hypothetical protein [Herbaspirillum seropedicae]